MKTNNFEDISRRSIKRDFAHANYKRAAHVQKPLREKNVRRVAGISETSLYYRFRRHIVGRLVRIIEALPGGVWVEFVHAGDRENLNAVAGWTDKRKYMLDGVKFSD